MHLSGFIIWKFYALGRPNIWSEWGHNDVLVAIACIFVKRTRYYNKIENFYKDMKITGTVFVDYSFYLYNFTQTRTGIAPP